MTDERCCEPLLTSWRTTVGGRNCAYSTLAGVDMSTTRTRLMAFSRLDGVRAFISGLLQAQPVISLRCGSNWWSKGGSAAVAVNNAPQFPIGIGK